MDEAPAEKRIISWEGLDMNISGYNPLHAYRNHPTHGLRNKRFIADHGIPELPVKPVFSVENHLVPQPTPTKENQWRRK